MNGMTILTLSLMLTATHDVPPAPQYSALVEVNQLRAMRGLPAFEADPQLMAVAEQRAALLASYGSCGYHPPGSFYPARYEGVGCGYQFNSCYLYSYAGHFAGAATVERNGRRFHVLLIR